MADEAGIKRAPGGFVDGILDEDNQQSPGAWIHWPARSVGRVCLVRPSAFAFLTHWDKGTNHFCWGAGNCPYHAERQGFKGHYVLTVWDTARRCHGALDLSKDAYRDLLEQLEFDGLRTGRLVYFRKEGGVVNGKWIVEAQNSVLKVSELGEPCDVVALVARTYAIDLDRLKEHLDIL